MSSSPLKMSLLALLSSCVLAHAGLVNAISVIVNNEPITLYEIHKVSSQKNISLRESLDFLVQERLEDSQIKRLGITTNAFEVQSRIEGVAAQNGISVSELRAFLQSRGMDMVQYEQELARTIKQEKLYQRIFANAISPIDAAQVRHYYDTNPDEFMQPTRFSVVRYEAPTGQLLEQVMASPMSVITGVNIEEEVLNASMLDGRTHYFLSQTAQGEFTPIATTPQGAVMFLVRQKSNFEKVPFAQVEQGIENFLEEKRRVEAIENYFEKLKASADIVVLRRP